VSVSEEEHSDEEARMTTALLERAKAGDGAAFRELVDPFRRELHVHCYRMLGSYQDAEDMLQETLLAAWAGLAGYEGRSSLRTWLYRIATNSCLNARRAESRRPVKEWNVPNVQPPEPTRLGEVPWLEPYPDVALDGLAIPLGPEARFEQSESMSLAFVTALQALPPRQVAVLILRDVLGFPAQQVAEMLGTTVSAVTSALKRARATLAERRDQPVSMPGPPDQELIERFVRAYGSADVDGLVALLTDDVFISMPPLPFEYQGIEAVTGFFAIVFRSGRELDLVPTSANGQPAFGAYLRGPDGVSHGDGLTVLTLRGPKICAMTRFETGMLSHFGLPRALRSE
jgi:RNA polymerase sigma-70 factor (TIGR02960 family)